MNTNAPAIAEDLAVVPAAPVTSPVRNRIMIYLTVLILLLGFGSPAGGLIDIPIQFFLKNKLHLKADQVALFRLASGIPLYLSFLFGFVRDTWNPFGMRDRGFMVLFGAICCGIYVYFAFSQFSYLMLLVAVVLLTSAFLFVFAAQNGLTAAAGQQHVMSGQVSTLFNVVTSVPILSAYAIGGLLSQQLEGKNGDQAARTLFLVGGAIMAAVTVFGLWRSKSVYDNIHPERKAKAFFGDDIVRLFAYWKVWSPAMLIWLLFNFAPGSQTPLQYYMQDTLKATDTQWGLWNAIFAGSFIPTFLIFGWLCRKYPLRTLLFWGTVIAVPQMMPLVLIHTVTGALLAAIPIGLMGGIASAAYVDLLIRSCPPALQGTIIMLSNTFYYLVSRVGDLLGTRLYEQFHSFTVCALAITAVYALILPALLLVPKRLTATPDGQAIEGGFGDAVAASDIDPLR